MNREHPCSCQDVEQLARERDGLWREVRRQEALIAGLSERVNRLADELADTRDCRMRPLGAA